MTGIKTAVGRVRCRLEVAARREAPPSRLSIESLLLPISSVYGGLMRLRARLYDSGILPSATLPCRVVSIGNIVAGGTGKTPMTIFVAQIIRDLGYRVVVVSRGYRGRLENRGGVVSDGHTLFKGPEDAGDEPFMMARLLRGIPIVVGRRRHEAGMLAIERFKPDVIVLDDAFQHMRLKRDLDLVLLDSRLPIANGHLLPRGLLREPVSALHRAGAVIFTRDHGAVSNPFVSRLPQRKPIFVTAHTPAIVKTDTGEKGFFSHGTDWSCLKGKKMLAFSGIGDNQQFFDSLAQTGGELVHTLSFADHHRYRHHDLAGITDTAKEKGADILVTTLKDFVKVGPARQWPLELIVVDVSIRMIGSTERFIAFLSEALGKAQG